MKYFVTGLLLWFIALLPRSAESAEETYHIITFQAGMKAAMKGDGKWKTCSDYFAAVETGSGKVIHFTFEKSPSSTIFAFTKIDRVIVSIQKNVTTPTVIVLEDRVDAKFILKMNVEDYKAGLPCLTKVVGA